MITFILTTAALSLFGIGILIGISVQKTADIRNQVLEVQVKMTGTKIVVAKINSLVAEVRFGRKRISSLERLSIISKCKQ